MCPEVAQVLQPLAGVAPLEEGSGQRQRVEWEPDVVLVPELAGSVGRKETPIRVHVHGHQRVGACRVPSVLLRQRCLRAPASERAPPHFLRKEGGVERGAVTAQLVQRERAVPVVEHRRAQVACGARVGAGTGAARGDAQQRRRRVRIRGAGPPRPAQRRWRHRQDLHTTPAAGSIGRVPHALVQHSQVAARLPHLELLPLRHGLAASRHVLRAGQLPENPAVVRKGHGPQLRPVREVEAIPVLRVAEDAAVGVGRDECVRSGEGRLLAA